MINVDKLPLKYITESYRLNNDYPTPLDLLYDISKTGKTQDITAFAECYDDAETVKNKLTELEELGYVKTTNNKVKLVKTPWDE